MAAVTLFGRVWAISHLVSLAICLPLLSRIARAFRDGLLAARAPDARLTPADPWIFFDRVFAPRATRLRVTLALVAVVGLVITVGAVILTSHHAPARFVATILGTSLCLAAFNAVIGWCLCYVLAPRLDSELALTAVVWLSVALIEFVCRWAGTAPPDLDRWFWTVIMLAVFSAPSRARLRGPRWFRFEE